VVYIIVEQIPKCQYVTYRLLRSALSEDRA